MKTVQDLERVIDKQGSESDVFTLSNGELACSNFPDSLEIQIIDYINCHFDVTFQDKFSVTFKLKK